jgi:thiamine biosynthesis lipoprotein
MTRTTERHLRAMGCDVHLVVVTDGDGTTVLDALVARLDHLERRWSRFLPDSDVRTLARAGGEPLRVEADTRLLVERMKVACTATHGWYDPTVGQALVDLGYDRTFTLLGATRAVRTPAGPPGRGTADIVVEDGTVTVPAGVLLDAGSIGKGLAADLLLDVARDAGATGTLVNLGGDVACAGEDERGAPWGVVVVSDARRGAPTVGERVDPADGDLVVVRDAVLVTSTTLRRRWQGPDGSSRHHLVDPSTGTPTSHDLHTVTVLSTAGWWADAAATAVLAAGPAGIGLAVELGLVCRLTFADDQVLDLGGFEGHLAPPRSTHALSDAASPA